MVADDQANWRAMVSASLVLTYLKWNITVSPPGKLTMDDFPYIPRSLKIAGAHLAAYTK